MHPAPLKPQSPTPLRHPTLQTAPQLRMSCGTARMTHLLGLDLFGEITRDVARAVIRQQPRLVQYMSVVAGWCGKRQVERLGDVFGPHVGTQFQAML